jgi:GT2 family glycosyltransferase
VSVTKDKISVIIITHNSMAMLPRCLKSLKAAVAGLAHELIVLDNASAEDPAGIVLTELPEAKILKAKRNIGFAAGCNRAVAEASGEYLLFVNPDVMLDPEAVTALRAQFDSNRRLGLAAGRLRFPDGRFQPSCRRLPSLANLLLSRGSFLSALWPSNSRPSGAYTLGDSELPVEVPAVSGAMMMTRTDFFRRLGGFDPRFFMYMEDTDLSAASIATGHVNLFVPTAGAEHYWGASSPTGKFRRKWRHHLSTWKYFRKHHRRTPVTILLPFLLAANLALALVLPERRAR